MAQMIQAQAKIIHGWKAYELSAGQLSLSVIPLGGRIISLKFCGEEFLFVQKEHAGESFDFRNLSKEALETKKRELGFRLWGGDKTWPAPQAQWTQAIPPLVLDGGTYTIQCQGPKITLISLPDPETGLQISREIILSVDDQLQLKQSFYNHSDKPIQRGIWDVSQIMRNIYVYIPVQKQAVIPYPEEGRSIALLPQMLSEASTDWTRIRCDEPAHFKYGAKLERGQIVTFKQSQKKNTFLIMERLFAVEPKSKYAHDVVIEVYNSPSMNYAEVEVHAPLQIIPPGKSVYHSQTWRFRKTTREDITEIH